MAATSNAWSTHRLPNTSTTILTPTTQSIINNITVSFINGTTNASCGECPCDTNDTSGSVEASEATRALQVYYPIIVIVGILGNVLNLCILTKKPFLKSSSCIFLIGLAVADTLVLVFETGMKYVFFKAFGLTQHHGFHVYLCVYNNFILIACVRITFFITVAFTIERYINIKFPVKARSWCTAERAKKTLPCLYVGAFILASHQLPLREVRCGQCTFVDLGPNVQRGMTILNATTFILVFLLLIVFNGLIIYELRENSVNKFSSHNFRRTRFRGSNRITVLLVIVSVIFLVIWLPWLAVYLSNDLPNNKKYASYQRDDLQFVAQCTSGLNSAVNFFLYSLVSQRFRRELKRSFCQLYRKDKVKQVQLRKRKSAHPYCEAITRLNVMSQQRLSGDCGNILSTQTTRDAFRRSGLYISNKSLGVVNDAFVHDESDDSGVGESDRDLQTRAAAGYDGYRTIRVVRQPGPGGEIILLPETIEEDVSDLASSTTKVIGQPDNASCSVRCHTLTGASAAIGIEDASRPMRPVVKKQISFELAVSNRKKDTDRKRSQWIISSLFSTSAPNQTHSSSVDNPKYRHRILTEIPSNMSRISTNTDEWGRRGSSVVRNWTGSLLNLVDPTIDPEAMQEGLLLDICAETPAASPSLRRRDSDCETARIPLPTPSASPKLTPVARMPDFRALRRISSVQLLRSQSSDQLQPRIPMHRLSKTFSVDCLGTASVPLRDGKVVSLLRAVSRDELDACEQFEIIEATL